MTSIEVYDSVFKKLDEKSEELDIDLTDLVEILVENYLDEI